VRFKGYSEASMNTEDNRLISVRLWWSIAAVIATLLGVFGGFWWNHERMWTLSARDGRPLCRVQEGWTEQEVSVHCGAPSGRGTQPKVPGGGPFSLQMCSAPGDVYGTKVVFYGCDRKVTTVEQMPTGDFIYPSD